MGGSRFVKVVIQLYFRIIMLSTFCEQTSLRLVAKVREIVPRFIGVVVVVVVVSVVVVSVVVVIEVVEVEVVVVVVVVVVVEYSFLENNYC